MANHSFISRINNKHSFNLTLLGFSINSTFIAKIQQRIVMTINMTLSTDWTFPLVLKKVTLTLNNNLIKLLIHPTLPLTVKKVSFVATMRQAMKFASSFNVKSPTITAIMRTLEKITSWPLKVPKVAIAFSPVVAKFAILSTYDPQTLSTLDTMSLTDMDYTV